MKNVILLYLVCLPSLSHAALGLTFNGNDKRVVKFIDEVQKRLPRALVEDINQKIEVRFEKLDDLKTIQSPCETKQLFGKQIGNTIILNRNFLPVLNTYESLDFDCGHKSYKRLALATLIHEIAHVYDHEKKVSKDPAYLSLVNVGKNFSIKTQIKNTKIERSPDPYEYTDLAEHFAVNMEYFLLDSEYKCRRPNLNRLFNEKLKASMEVCENYPEIKISNGSEGTSFKLNPENVKRMSFVLAGKGEAVMSKFGHAMFKLELKNPEREIMVGFLGIIDDTAINNVKGLTGAYPSRMTIGLYSETVTRYTKKELRSLSEYELKFSSAQKRDFLQHIMSLYFEYSGRYYFITNNCASEAINLLKVAYRSPEFFNENPITPSKVLEVLKKHKLINEEPKVQNSYEVTLKKIFHNSKGALEDVSFVDYLQRPASVRRESMKLSGVEKTQLRSLFALEMALNDRAQDRLENEIMTEIRKLDENDEVRKLSIKAIQLGNVLIDVSTTDKGYGIPMNHNSDRNDEKIYEELNEIFHKMADWSKTHMKSEAIYEAQENQENVELIRSALKAN